MDEYRRYGRRQLPVSDRGSPPAEHLPFRLHPLRSSRASAIAASLIVIISGLGVWQAVGPEPEANVLIVDLFAYGSTRDSESKSNEAVVDFTGGAPSCLLLVHSPDPDLSRSSYHAVIQTADGRDRFQSGDLRPSAFGTFNLSFSDGFFDPGDYVLTLYGDSTEVLGEYAFSVQHL